MSRQLIGSAPWPRFPSRERATAYAECRELVGNDFLEKFKGFPYVVIVSALGSMEDAATAMISGAQGVFDKDPESLERMLETVCKVATAGFVLRGKGSDYLSTFLLLANPAIQTPQDWGAAAAPSVI